MPLAGYVVYIVKLLLFTAAALLVCSAQATGDNFAGGVADGWMAAIARHVERALAPAGYRSLVAFASCFEIMGFGCGSGPLTGHYLPAFTAPLWHWLTPGTVRLPPFGRGATRTSGHVLLYAASCGALAVAAAGVVPERASAAVCVALLAAVGLGDLPAFLAARPEHYGTVLLCVALADDDEAWLLGAKVVTTALWLWAGVAKLNLHFPSVVCAMLSNSPLVRSAALRRMLYIAPPQDLRPSAIARLLAHAGIVAEVALPLALWSPAEGVRQAAACGLTAFHLWIIANAPMGAPNEWNVVMIASVWSLFMRSGNLGVTQLGTLARANAMLAGALVLLCVVMPMFGNLFPSHCSFLLSMRYYAGNWPYSAWIFRDDKAQEKLERIPKVSQLHAKQLKWLYGSDEIVAQVLRKVPAFRCMHVQGRALGLLVPRALKGMGKSVERDFKFMDGELVAGLCFGWNFGDGHLSSSRLLERVQHLCNFEAGELRHVSVESQPLLGPASLAYEIRDAKEGLLLDAGSLDVASLAALQPWHEGPFSGTKVA